MDMELHKLYGDWAQMKSNVVSAAAALLENYTDPSAVMELTAMLLAEKQARADFEAAFQEFKRSER